MTDFATNARRAKVAAIVRTLDGLARLNGIPVRGRQADTIAAADEATWEAIARAAHVRLPSEATRAAVVAELRGAL